MTVARASQPASPKPLPGAFRNRIVGHGEAAPEQLLANPRNWRIHPPAQRDALSALLERVGWVSDVVINRRTGYVVDGHLRVALAISRGEPKVPVKYIDVSEEEEGLILATLDPLSAMATADKDRLEELLRGLTNTDDSVSRLLDELAAENKIDLRGEPPTDPGAQMDRADELREKWGTERGQVWVVGEHRIMCGDSTDEGDVAKLMAGTTARLLLCDPPYGVNYETDGKNPRWRSSGTPIANDDLGKEQGPFWTAAFRHWQLDGDAYVFSPSGPLISTLCASIEAAGIEHTSGLSG